MSEEQICEFEGQNVLKMYEEILKQMKPHLQNPNDPAVLQKYQKDYNELQQIVFKSNIQVTNEQKERKEILIQVCAETQQALKLYDQIKILKGRLEFQPDYNQAIPMKIYEKQYKQYDQILDPEKPQIEHNCAAIIESIIQQMKQFKDMPACFEQSVIKLCYYLSLAVMPESEFKKDIIFKKTNFNTEINECYNELITQYELESSNFYGKTDQIKLINHIDDIKKSGINPENYEKSLKSLFECLLLLRPFNFKEFFELLTVSNEDQSMIEQKRIMMMLGSTGCGKSTTIQYLFGCPMKRKQTRTSTGAILPHIQSSVPIKNKQLQKVVTKPDAKSITRNFTPIPTTFKDSRGSQKELVIGDTAGSGDLQGAEIDIANSIGILKAAQMAKYVHPVLIFSSQNFGARYEILKSQILLYSCLVSNLAQNVNHFNYLFTSVQKGLKLDQVIKEVKMRLDPSELLNSSLVTILNDMQEKGQKSPSQLILVDPLEKDGHKKILENIIENPAIDNPKKVFQVIISEKSRVQLNKQFTLHENNIKRSLKNGNIELALWRLEELEQLAQIFSSFDKTYQEKLKYLHQSLNEILAENLKQIASSIQRSLSPDNSLIDSDLTNLLRSYTIAEKAEPLREKYLQSASSLKDFVARIVQLVKEQRKHVQKKEIDHPEWYQLISKVQKLSNVFQPCLKPLQTIIKKLSLRIGQIKNQVKEILEATKVREYVINNYPIGDEEEQKNQSKLPAQSDFSSEEDKKNVRDLQRSESQVAKSHIKFKRTMLILVQSLEKIKIDEIDPQDDILSEQIKQITYIINFYATDINRIFSSKIQTHIQKIQQIQLSEEERDTIQGSITMVQLFCQESEFINFEIFKNLNQFYNETILKCVDKFNEHANSLIAITTNSEAISIQKVNEIKKIFELIELLRSINQIARETDSVYFQLIIQIQNTLQQTQDFIESFLAQLEKQDISGVIDEQKLNSLQSSIKSFNVLGKIFESPNINIKKKNNQEYLRTKKLAIISKFKNVLGYLENEVRDRKVDTSITSKTHLIEAGLLYNQIKAIYATLNSLGENIDDITQEIGKDWVQTIGDELNKIINTYQEQPQSKIMQIQDYKKIENYQNYIDQLKNKQIKQLREDVQRKIGIQNVEQISERLVQIITNQREQIDKEFTSSFNVLKNLNNEDQTEKQKCANQIISIMRVLKLLKRSYQSILLLISQQDDDHDQIDDDRLQKHYSKQIIQWVTEEEDIIQLHIKDFGKFQAKLQSLKLLRIVDEFLTNNSEMIVAAHFKKGNDLLFVNPSTELSQAQQIFKSGEYLDLKLKLEILVKGSTQTPHLGQIAEKIKQFISNKVSEYIDQIQKSIMGTITPDEIAKIFSASDELLKIQVGLEEFINKNTIIGTIKNAINQIFDSINTLYNEAISHINYQRYQQVIDIKQILEKLCNSFNQSSSSNVRKEFELEKIHEQNKKKIQDIEDQMKENIKTVLNQIDMQEIYDYSNIRPRMRNSLESIATIISSINDNQYQNTIEEILKKINNQTQLFENVENLSSDQFNDIRQKAKILQEIIINCCPKIDQFKQKIDYIGQQVKNLEITQRAQELQYQQKVDQKLEKATIEDIIELIENRPKSQQNDQIIKQFQNPLNNKFQEKIEIAKKLLIHNMKQYLEKIQEIQANLENVTIQSLISRVTHENYSKLQKLFNKTIQSAINELNKMLTNSPWIASNSKNANQVSIIFAYQKQFESSGEEQMDIKIALDIFAQLGNIKNSNSDYDNLIYNLSPDLSENLNDLLDRTIRYLKKQEELWQKSFAQKNIVNIYQSIENIQQKYEIIHKFVIAISKIQKLCETTVSKMLSLNYEIAKNQTIELITEIQTNLLSHKSLINSATLNDQQSRFKFYQQLQKDYDTLNFTLTKELFKSIQENSKQSIHHCKGLVESIIKGATENIERLKDNTMTRDNYSDIELQYNNLIAMNECLIIYKSEVSININEIEREIKKSLTNIKQSAQDAYSTTQSLSIPNLAIQLIKLQIISNSLIHFKDRADSVIKEILVGYQEQYKKVMTSIIDLKQELNKYSPEGTQMTQKHTIFLADNMIRMNEKFQSLSKQNGLDQLKGTDLDKEVLSVRYDEYKKEYDQIVTDSIATKIHGITGEILPIKYESIISNIRSSLVMKNNDSIKWSTDEIDRLPSLMANIFALWTLMNTEIYENQKNIQSDHQVEEQQLKGYLFQPHVSQIMSIFRMLGVGYEEKDDISSLQQQVKEKVQKFFCQNISDKFRKCRDNLVQIKTGEGKSVTLAVVAIIFALQGFEVKCACYSSYLSSRDYKNFEKVFSALGVADKIFYGTFNEICEKQLNSNRSVRDLVLDYIMKDKNSINSGPIAKEDVNSPPQILLIDEVDVFFKPDFFGNIYTPQAQVNHDKISKLIDHIWGLRETNIKQATIFSSQHYLECKDVFKPQFINLLEEAVKDMISDLKSYEGHDYIILDGKIGYKLQDSISFNIQYGYKTMWTYYLEHSNGRISNEEIKNQKVIGINCGEFSYAEIPLGFSIILGVTGTLETLSETEKNILKNIYNIKHFTIAPSVHVNAKTLKFDPFNNIDFVSRVDHYRAITGTIYQIRKGEDANKRPFLIFFENEEELKKFNKSEEFMNFLNQSQVLNELVKDEDKEAYIIRATLENKITLATRAFGRGTDFVCYLQTGGLYVIQTFLSEEESEEVQIKGRTARQGSIGYYCQILCYEDLKEKFDIDEHDIKESPNKEKTLKQFRDKKLKQAQDERIKLREEMKIKNDTGLEILEWIKTNNSQKNEEIKRFLQQLNKSFLVETDQKIIKSLILLDVTHSMAPAIEKTKNIIVKMCEKMNQILKSNNYDGNLSKLKFGCYRNYNSANDILVQSEWDTNPQNLRRFLSTVQATQGFGNEAIEIALWLANQELKRIGESSLQIFIIADAFANSRDEVTFKRKNFNQRKQFDDLGQDFWKKHKLFKHPTYWEDEIAPLKQAGVPIHVFYIANGKTDDESKLKSKQLHEEFLPMTVGNYEDSKGECCRLEIENEETGAKQLQDFFSEQILKRIGQVNGGADQAEKLVKAYRSFR